MRSERRYVGPSVVGCDPRFRCRSRTGAGSLVRGPPGNARVPREPDPPGRRGLCLCLRTRGVFRDPEEELRRLLLEAFVPSPEAPSGRTVDESRDRKSTRLNSSHRTISYAVFCLKKKKKILIIS